MLQHAYTHTHTQLHIVRIIAKANIKYNIFWDGTDEWGVSGSGGKTIHVYSLQLIKLISRFVFKSVKLAKQKEEQHISKVNQIENWNKIWIFVTKNEHTYA